MGLVERARGGGGLVLCDTVGRGVLQQLLQA